MKIKKYLKPVMVVAGVSTITGLVGIHTYREDLQRQGLEVYVIDLKYGHSIFIRTSEDERILINGGYNTEILNKLAYHLPFYSRRIDTIIATNMDKNSIGGLVPVIERYSISKVYLPRYYQDYDRYSSSTSPVGYSFLKLVTEDKGLVIDEIGAGDILSLRGGVEIEILFPMDDYKFKYSKSSPPLLLFNIKYQGKNISYFGNAGSRTQNTLASNWHSTSTDALISIGGNKPGFITKLMAQNLKPQNLIYSEKDSKTPVGEISAIKSKSSKKDNLEYIVSSHRYNINDRTVKISISKEKIAITNLDDDSFLGESD